MEKIIDEQEIDKQINFIADTTLGGLKGVFVHNNLNDRQATLCLMKFIEVFVAKGWKDNKPIEVLENIKKVLEDIENDKEFENEKGKS